MVGKLFLHAPNIHQGGGRTLLSCLLAALPEDINVYVQLDIRMKIPHDLPRNFQVTRVEPRSLARLKAELRLRSLTGKGDVVLCLGNLPPLFRLAAKVFVFVQNRYLVEKIDLHSFPFLTRLRMTLEREWLVRRALPEYEFIVQSPTMQGLLSSLLGREPLVLPFVDDVSGFARVGSRSSTTRRFDFLYVASGEVHKNHLRLLEAWVLLAKEGFYPSLCLTLEENECPILSTLIDRLKREHRVHIENIFVPSPSEIKNLYTQSAALIYPSLFESLGLPLIEARKFGLPILASEKDYVRDLVDPEESFDPTSSLSIARAVKRFMNVTERKLPLMDARSFLQHLVAGDDIK